MNLIFDQDNFYGFCDQLGNVDKDLQDIIHIHGYPPRWSREPGFATLIHIILEQQVSLASAGAAMKKLALRIGQITPAALSSLSDEDLKACYFSRQKIRYARHLFQAVLSGALDLERLSTEADDDVITELKKINGIGDWTADIYLMMALRRTDRFPPGDIALRNSLAAVKRLKAISKEEVHTITASWKPYRTIAAYLLWHAYLSKQKKKLTTPNPSH